VESCQWERRWGQKFKTTVAVINVPSQLTVNISFCAYQISFGTKNENTGIMGLNSCQCRKCWIWNNDTKKQCNQFNTGPLQRRKSSKKWCSEKMGEGWTRGASDIVKAKSSGEDPRQLEASFPNLLYPRVNKTKQHGWNVVCIEKQFLNLKRQPWITLCCPEEISNFELGS